MPIEKISSNPNQMPRSHQRGFSLPNRPDQSWLQLMAGLKNTAPFAEYASRTTGKGFASPVVKFRLDRPLVRLAFFCRCSIFLNP